MLRISFFILINLFFYLSAQSATNLSDSVILKKNANYYKLSNAEKVDVLLEIANSNYFKQEYKNALYYAQRAQSVIEGQNLIKQQGISNGIIGLILLDLGEYKRSNVYNRRSFYQFSELKDTSRMVSVLQTITENHQQQNLYGDALSTMQKAYAYARLSNNILDQITVHNDFAIVLNNQGKNDQAREMYLKALSLGKEKDIPVDFIYNNLAQLDVKMAQYDYNRVLKYYKLAKEYFKNENNILKSSTAIPTIENNIFKIKIEHNYVLNKALEFRHLADNSNLEIRVSYYRNMSNYLYKNDLINELKNHLNIIEKELENSRSLSIKLDVYKYLCQMYSKIEEHEKFSKIQGKLISTYQGVVSNKTESNKVKQEIINTLDKYEREAKLLKTKVTQKEQVIFNATIVSIVLIILVFAIVIIYRKQNVLLKHRITVHSLKLSNSELLLEKNKLELKQLIDKHQSQPTLEENNIKGKGLSILESKKILTNEDWIAFKLKFTDVYPDFILNLKTNFSNLTESEIRLIVLTKLGFRQSHMADNLGISINTVKKTRQGLRIKLNIQNGEQLKEHINNECFNQRKEIVS